ncbi:MAG TPA: NAD(P)-dependent oxidoreductase [Terriglobales bacterium]|nr:NAD(P)-dependent oxidoreductase [Terriglobales bacterium]
MKTREADSWIVRPDDLILVTGATGFIGRRVVKALLELGFRNLRCLTRLACSAKGFEEVLRAHAGSARVEVVTGNLLSVDDCAVAAKSAALVFHLAAGRGEKSFPDAFANSVVTTRNLLDACVAERTMRRFVNMSSFAVYKNSGNPKWRLLDESAPIEDHPELRGNAYCFAKTEQDKLVMEYGRRFAIPYVIIRPGWVYGPGNPGIHGRVGIGTFGVFLHLGGGNTLPLTYVDNCAEAVVLAGVTRGVDDEVFNVVDDNLPSSRRFLRLYKRSVRRFHSIYVPHALSYYLCCLWGWYSKWSRGQLPPVYNRKAWRVSWKRTRYSNAKLKSRVGWQPSVPTSEGLRLYFESCRIGGSNT